MDYTRLVFERLHAAGNPDSATRQQIYQQCRDEISSLVSEPARALALEKLEKVIRRQEMQALYEESHER